MIYFKWVIRFYLYCQYSVHRLLNMGAFGKEQAKSIKKDYKPTGNLIKDGLFFHHVKQFNEASCSVATVAAVVNTLLDRNGALKGKGVSQHQLLARVNVANWQERMGDGGYKGKRGLPLETLGQVVRGSLEAYDIDHKAVEIVHVTNDMAISGIAKQELRSRLIKFEQSGDCLVIAHFNQGCFLKVLHIPHISPVGGFDPRSDRVTMLDVDTFVEHHYEIPFDTFYKGLSSNYNHVFRPFGFKSGGYIVILL